MNYKYWIISGILMFLAGTGSFVWGMYKSFSALASAENAGIGEVSAFYGFCVVGGVSTFGGKLLKIVLVWQPQKRPLM